MGRKPAAPSVATGRIFTQEQLATRWTVAVSAVQRMCRDGSLPGAFKVAGKWRLSEEALLRYERPLNPMGGVPVVAVVAVTPAKVTPVASAKPAVRSINGRGSVAS